MGVVGCDAGRVGAPVETLCSPLEDSPVVLLSTGFSCSTTHHSKDEAEYKIFIQNCFIFLICYDSPFFNLPLSIVLEHLPVD